MPMDPGKAQRAAKPGQPLQDEGTPLPGICVGDEVFFRHAKGPTSGKVVAHGQHGATIEHQGKQHKVAWKHVLAHKMRVAQEYQVETEGEDGMIVRDAAGGRHFIGIPPEAREDRMLIKSATGGHRLVIFTKAGAPGVPYTGRAGLAKKQITDKNGVQTTRWVSTKPDDQPLEAGHHVGFANGEHKGHGKVMAAGKDGLTVQDKAGGLHRVPHAATTHRWEGGGEPDTSPHEKPAEASAAKASEPLFKPEELAHLPPKANQPFSSWEELLAKSSDGVQQFTSQLDSVVKAMNLKTGVKGSALTPEDWASPEGYLFMGAVKSEKRSKEKVAADYGGDWSQLRDVVRASISVATMADVKQALDHCKAAGIEIAQQPKDRFAKPLDVGYRDLMMVVKLPNGMLAELQLHVKSMSQAKRVGHAHYETVRSLQAKHNEEQPSDKWDEADHTAFYDAITAQKDLYAKAWDKAQGGSAPQEDKPMQKALAAPKMVLVFGGK